MSPLPEYVTKMIYIIIALIIIQLKWSKQTGPAVLYTFMKETYKRLIMMLYTYMYLIHRFSLIKYIEPIHLFPGPVVSIGLSLGLTMHNSDKSSFWNWSLGREPIKALFIRKKNCCTTQYFALIVLQESYKHIIMSFY
jgi:hypothetical protein